jgi:hypothetical protein
MYGKWGHFVDLLKKNIHMNRRKSRAVSQLTLDDDYNVLDAKPDVNRIIQKKGDIAVDDIKVTQDHIVVIGSLEVKILYIGDTESKLVHKLEAKLSFEENINLDGVVSGDNIRLKWDIEDLSANLINSRKLNLKAIVTFIASVEDEYDTETAVDIEDEDISCKHKRIDTMQMVVNKKDTIRVKDEISLTSNKPNIYEILWDSIQLRGTDIRVVDEKVEVKGEFFIFILYAGDDENNTMQWLETALPFEGYVDCNGCRSDMISNIEISIMNTELEVRPDYDGEERIVQVDIVLELDMKLYEEEHIEILQDMYTPSQTLTPITKEETYQSLLVKNFSKCRVNDRIRIDNNQTRMLQVCHSEGEVKIDEVTIVDNGIDVEGVVNILVLYITADDKMPFYSMSGMVPFHHVIEAPGIDKSCVYRLNATLEQLSTTMIDSEEMEAKATIDLNALVIKRQKENIIVDVEEADLDLNELQSLPGLVGYIVQDGDTLWDIAKQFYTTTEQIKELNEISSEEVKLGDRLIIMKTVENLKA